MCSRRILRELVMNMLVTTNGVNKYGKSTYTIHKDLRKIYLTSFSRVHFHMSLQIPLDLSDVRKHQRCQKTSESRIFYVIISDARILNITSSPEAHEPLDS